MRNRPPRNETWGASGLRSSALRNQQQCAHGHRELKYCHGSWMHLSQRPRICGLPLQESPFGAPLPALCRSAPFVPGRHRNRRFPSRRGTRNRFSPLAGKPIEKQDCEDCDNDSAQSELPSQMTARRSSESSQKRFSRPAANRPTGGRERTWLPKIARCVPC